MFDDPVMSEINGFNRHGLELAKNLIGKFFLSLIRPAATLTEVLYRNELGERYFTLWNVIGGIPLLVAASIPVEAIRWAAGQADYENTLHAKASWILGGMWLFVFCYRSWFTFKATRERYEQQRLWHSYSTGIGVIELDNEIPPQLQPLIPVVAGVVLLVGHFYGLGVLAIFSGYISLQSRAIEAALFYTKVLDAIDGQIEQEQLSKAVLQRRNPQETDGFIAPIPTYVSTAHREKFLKGVGAPRARPAKSTPDVHGRWAYPPMRAPKDR